MCRGQVVIVNLIPATLIRNYAPQFIFMKFLHATIIFILGAFFALASFSQIQAKNGALGNTSYGLCLNADGRIEIGEAQTYLAKKGGDHTVLEISKSVGVSKGTVFMIPDSRYNSRLWRDNVVPIVAYFNGLSYDVATLVCKRSNKMMAQGAYRKAFSAYRYVQSYTDTLPLNTTRLILFGRNKGAHIAAKLAQRLAIKEQPDALILTSPEGFDSRLTGTVMPAVMPPTVCKAQLLVLTDVADADCEIYFKTWKGYGGRATWQLSDNQSNGTRNDQLGGQLDSIALFLNRTDLVPVQGANPAEIATEGYNKGRLKEKLKCVSNHKYDLIFMGNSLIHNFEKPIYQPVWQQFFAPRNALNLGFSGYRTENLLWNIEQGVLNGQSPQVIILEVGTNNVDEVHYPTRHNALQVAGGIEAVVKEIQFRLPHTKIVLLRPFPGSYDGAKPTSHRAILDRTADIVSQLHDGKQVFYCDVNYLFLNMDGTLKKELMPDWLHPNPAGAKLWAQAMEPLLAELMGDTLLDVAVPENSAIVPVPKLERDSYNWWDRHHDVLAIKDTIDPEIVLIGNSITHFWGGEPQLKYADGRTRKPNGAASWNKLFGRKRVLNLGFGWDRTQNVLWRLDNGELDGLHPSTVIIHNGTNNTSETANARANTAPEIVEGIAAICHRVRSKVPQAKIILMAVFPRQEKPDHPRRLLIYETNRLLEDFAAENNITLLDISKQMLTKKGVLERRIARDFCHPTEVGYSIWAEALFPFVTEVD